MFRSCELISDASRCCSYIPQQATNETLTDVTLVLRGKSRVGSRHPHAMMGCVISKGISLEWNAARPLSLGGQAPRLGARAVSWPARPDRRPLNFAYFDPAVRTPQTCRPGLSIVDDVVGHVFATSGVELQAGTLRLQMVGCWLTHRSLAVHL